MMKTGDSNSTRVYRLDFAELANVLQMPKKAELLEFICQDSQQTAVTEVGETSDYDLPVNQVFRTPPVRLVLVDAVCYEGKGQLLNRPFEITPLIDNSNPKSKLTVVELLLYNLFLAGINSVVFLVNAKANTLMQHIHASNIAKKVSVQFVPVPGNDLGISFSSALIEARNIIKEDFLYFQSTFLYQPELLHHMANELPDPSMLASVLVDPLANQKFQNPIKVQLDEKTNKAMVVGYSLFSATTASAGLFCLSKDIIPYLIGVQRAGKVQSLAQVLNQFASLGKVKTLSTNGRPWMALNIKTNMQEAKDDIFSSFYGNIHAPVKRAASLGLKKESSLVLGVPAIGRMMSLDSSVEQCHNPLQIMHLKGSIRSSAAEPSQSFSLCSDRSRSINDSLGDAIKLRVSEHKEKEPSLRFSKQHKRDSTDYDDYGKIETFNTEDQFDNFGNPMFTPNDEDRLIMIPDLDKTQISEDDAFLIRLPSLNRFPSNDEAYSSQFIIASQDPYEALPTTFGKCSEMMTLPSDCQSLEIEAFQKENIEDPQLKVTMKTRVPIIGWVLLLITLVSVASIGPLEESLRFPPLLMNFWRRTCSGAMFCPFAIKAWLNPEVKSRMFCPEARRPLLLSVLGITICTQFFYVSLMYLATPLVALFENTTPLFLLVVRIVSGQGISFMEGVGTSAALFGTAIISLASIESDPSSSGSSNFILGTASALVAAAGLAMYLSYGKQMRPYMDIPSLNFIVCIVSGLCTIVMELLIFRSDFGPYDDLPTTSVIGTLFGYFLVPKLFFKQIATSFVMDIVAMQGALAVLRYFEALLVSVVLLGQPIVVIFLDLLLGVSAFPDLVTIFGCVVVMIGCGFVMVASSGEQKKTVDASSVLQRTSFTAYPTSSETQSFYVKPIQRQPKQISPLRTVSPLKPKSPLMPYISSRESLLKSTINDTITADNYMSITETRRLNK